MKPTRYTFKAHAANGRAYRLHATATSEATARLIIQERHPGHPPLELEAVSCSEGPAETPDPLDAFKPEPEEAKAGVSLDLTRLQASTALHYLDKAQSEVPSTMSDFTALQEVIDALHAIFQ